MMHTVATLITDKAFAECLMIFNACKGSFLSLCGHNLQISSY